jgi:integrase
MATFYGRKGKRGMRWTARVRVNGREITDTFSTKQQAQSWAKAQEIAIETGEYIAPDPKARSTLLADAIDDFITHRASIGRRPGASFASGLALVKDRLGLTPLPDLTVKRWREFAHERIRGGASPQTVATDLAYMSAVVKHARKTGHPVDDTAPNAARRSLHHDDGLRIASKERKRRLTDTEIGRLVKALKEIEPRTALPLVDLAEFALATGMRRGEILALRWDEVDSERRVVTIKRKHPKEQDRREIVPLLRPNGWPRVDPLDIIRRQPRSSDRVFPYAPETLAFWMPKAIAAAGLAADDTVHDVVFHSLRHECLSRLAERGLDLLRLALVSGHRDLKSLRRYARPDPVALAAEWGAPPAKGGASPKHKRATRRREAGGRAPRQ